MTEQRDGLAALFAACWKDEALKTRFMSDPKSVLAEYGIDVPDGVQVNVVENSEDNVHVTMPRFPSSSSTLADEELAGVSGGWGASTISGGCPDEHHTC